MALCVKCHRSAWMAVIFLLASGLCTRQARAEEKKPAPRDSLKAAADSSSRAVGGPMTDSTMALDKEHSAQDYFLKREIYFYPHTKREDPFNFPLEVEGGVQEELNLNELELTGVIYSADGRSVGILTAASGRNFLVRTGDILGIATVGLIEANRLHLRLEQYGIVRIMTKELKPLAEEQDGSTGKQTGSGQEQQAEDLEYKGRPPSG